MAKKEILFVVSEFYQAGTERSTYEIDLALNKDKFKLSILCLIALNKSERWDDYYYPLHKALDTDVYFLDEINTITHPTAKQRIQRKLMGKPLPPERQNLWSFLDRFEKICFMGEYNYPILSRWMTLEQKAKSSILIQNSLYQKPDIYVAFDKKAHYEFLSPFEPDSYPWELREFSDYTHTFFPLCFHTGNTRFKKEYKTKENPKIGVFTRITHTKPLDPFIYAFQLLLDEKPHAELHFFGSGNPKDEGVLRYVEQLGLEKNVFFRGHVKDIVESATAEDLDLIWLHAYHGQPGGYAGFDICTTKIPQVFWDFGAVDDSLKDERFPMSNKLKTFVSLSLGLIENPEQARVLAEKQYAFVKENKDIYSYIHILEEFFAN